MSSEDALLRAAPYGVFALQGALMVVDERFFHRKRGLGRGESWGHVADTLVFVTALSIAAFAPPTGMSFRAYVACAAFSALIITKDEWIHARKCSAGEHWIHALLFVVHPCVLFAIGLLWVRQEGALLRMATVAGSFAFALYQWLYWIGGARAHHPRVNNTFYDDLGSLWYGGDCHAIALLRAETTLRLSYVRRALSPQNVPAGGRVLDVGCGGGLVTAPLAADGFEVKGIDRSPGAIAAARSRLSAEANLSYATGDAYALDEPSDSFDAVLLLDILEHLDQPERALAQAARVLKPGGLLLFHTFNRTWLSWLFAIHGMKLVVRDTPHDLHVYRFFIRPAELERMAMRQGLVLRDACGIRPHIFSRAFVSSIVRRRLHPGFSFVFSRSLGAGYIGYFSKTAPASPRNEARPENEGP